MRPRAGRARWGRSRRPGRACRALAAVAAFGRNKNRSHYQRTYQGGGRSVNPTQIPACAVSAGDRRDPSRCAARGRRARARRPPGRRASPAGRAPRRRADRRGAVTAPELPQHSPARLAHRAGERGLTTTAATPDPSTGTERARAGQRTGVTAWRRATHLAAEVHDRLVPIAGRLALEPSRCRVDDVGFQDLVGLGGELEPRHHLGPSVSIAATGERNAIDVTAAAVYGPIPGSASNALTSAGTEPS